MSFFKRLANLFGGRSGGRPGGGRLLTLYVLSRRCNEPIMGTVDLFNEVSQSEDSAYSYYTRKVLHTSGERRCFDQVEVELWFNQNKEVAHHDVTGGRWLDADEYAVELARFHAPPAEDDESHAETGTESGTESNAAPGSASEGE